MDMFTRQESRLPWIVLSAVIGISLLILLILAVSSRNWLYASLLLTALIAAGIFSARHLFIYQRTGTRSDQKRIDWETAEPEIQRQNLNIEVFELSRILEIESAQIGDLQSAYIVAEDLALRQIQQDEKVPLMRHVTIAKTPFEAIMVKGDVIICIDVSFLVVPDLRQEKIDAMLRKIATVKKTFAGMNIRMKVRLMMVLVTQLTEEDGDKLHSVLSRHRFEETPVDIDIRLLDFESLQKLYVTD